MDLFEMQKRRLEKRYYEQEGGVIYLKCLSCGMLLSEHGPIDLNYCDLI